METNVPGATISPDLDISLRHLFVFMAVVQTGSATGAAGKLFRANSSVARIISALESELDVRLFDRGPRGMLINEYGRTLLQRAERIGREFNAMSKALDVKRACAPGASSRLVFPSLLNGRRLAMIVSLPERQSMAAVARDYGVTQAAVSASLKEFEERLGVTLFERSPKGFVPTDIGQVLISHFRRSLAELRHIGPDLVAVTGSVQGTVRMRCPSEEHESCRRPSHQRWPAILFCGSRRWKAPIIR
jgi:LysR family transcriptional regulator, regulator for genes of the gallate degradation pathway